MYYVYMYVCMYQCIFEYTMRFKRMYVCMYVMMVGYGYTHVSMLGECMYACMFNMFVCVRVCFCQFFDLIQVMDHFVDSSKVPAFDLDSGSLKMPKKTKDRSGLACMFVCVYGMYVCMYVCMYDARCMFILLRYN